LYIISGPVVEDSQETFDEDDELPVDINSAGTEGVPVN